MNAPELLPCPFCGEQLVPTQSGDGYTHNRRVRSANNCVLNWVVIRPPHQDAWNRRADPRVTALVEAVERLGLRHYVASWNGELLEKPYEPHPAGMKATIPTTCGVVYAIDAAIEAAKEPGE